VTFYGDETDASRSVVDQLPPQLSGHEVDLSLLRMDFHPEFDLSGLADWIREEIVQDNRPGTAMPHEK
jgi:hypothetical protein